MNRRNFLKNTSAAGISIAALSPGLPARGDKDALPIFPDNFTLQEAGIEDLQKKMASGGHTAQSIAKLYLKRISKMDKKGPSLNAIIEINPDALAEAGALDRERKAGKTRGPLHGIPVLIKDNINTAGKMMTTAGSLALTGNVAGKDAFIISLLREAGAVVLGKTNLSEWANFRSTRSSSGWSSRGGQTRNPYVLDRNPSGSSSGSGAAVAANFCALAIGTETDGSIVSPASVNGIVGIKPTVGLWSRSGIIPISATQDSAGPMARTVRDATILLGALAGTDPEDPATLGSSGKAYKDYTKFLDPNGLKGKRIGMEKTQLQGHEGVVSVLNEAMELMKKMGATLVEVDMLERINEIAKDEYELLMYEFKDGLNRYLQDSNAPVKSLADVIRFNEQHTETVMPFFRQEILVGSQAKEGLDSQAYRDLLAKTISSRTILTEIMEQNNLDALSGITSGLSWCTDPVNGDYNTGFFLNTPAALAGFPHVTVPAGFVHELPIGISFFGKAYSEPQLLGMAYAYEQASKKRRVPKFLPSVKP